jgi:hypothetical protein
MCGRFAFNEEPRKLAEHLDLTGFLLRELFGVM